MLKAEDIVENYVRLRTRLMNPSSTHPKPFRAEKFAEKCHCRSNQWYLDDGVRKCSSCHEIWPVDEVLVPRNAIQMTKSDPENQHESLANLSDMSTKLLLARKKNPWAFAIFWGKTADGWGSFKKITNRCKVRYSKAPFPWNKDKVRRLYDQGRRNIEEAFRTS